eukprot:11925987-Karenia_brevis.AAC.1
MRGRLNAAKAALANPRGLESIPGETPLDPSLVQPMGPLGTLNADLLVDCDAAAQGWRRQP